jgi:hypothetical protein
LLFRLAAISLRLVAAHLRLLKIFHKSQMMNIQKTPSAGKNMDGKTGTDGKVIPSH